MEISRVLVYYKVVIKDQGERVLWPNLYQWSQTTNTTLANLNGSHPVTWWFIISSVLSLDLSFFLSVYVFHTSNRTITFEDHSKWMGLIDNLYQSSKHTNLYTVSMMNSSRSDSNEMYITEYIRNIRIETYQQQGKMNTSSTPSHSNSKLLDGFSR